MYKIGTFSKLVGVSTKTLIYYDTIGLLKPVKVDYENGYRYYDGDSISKLLAIQFMQSFGFTINEIISLSPQIINRKIKEINKKIDYLTFNINFLEKLKEKNMNLDRMTIDTASTTLLLGKWRYVGSSTNFKEILEEGYHFSDIKVDFMPSYLFFGEKNLGTDLLSTFGYSPNVFELTNWDNTTRQFSTFVFNYASNLILFERPSEKQKSEVVFHVYEKIWKKNTYTSNDIEFILEKHAPTIGAIHYPFDTELVGKWVMVDEIFESEVAQYDGKIREKDVGFTLAPLFDVLDITPEQDCYIMKDDDELTVNKTKVFNRENSKLRIVMGKQEKNTISIQNTLIRQVHNGSYRKIGNDLFMFVNLDNEPDIDEKMYVYKKRIKE